MTCTEERNGGVLILRPSGSLDAENANALLGKIAQLIEGGVRNLLLDFSAVTYVSSFGLRTVLTAAKRLASAEGKLALAEMNTQVRRIFEISGLVSVLVIRATKAEALNSFK
jgi:anti-anti-sigma factor